MSNYPTGVDEQTPSAPWNQEDITKKFTISFNVSFTERDCSSISPNYLEEKFKRDLQELVNSIENLYFDITNIEVE